MEILSNRKYQMLLAEIEAMKAKIEIMKECHNDLNKLVKEVAFNCDLLVGWTYEKGYTIKKKQ